MVSENQNKQSKLASETVTVSHAQKDGATGVNVSGYLSTAIYLGEVKKDTPESGTYAVVYAGSPIPLPPPDYLPFNPMIRTIK